MTLPRIHKYDTFNLPVEEIFYDEDFNCRGPFLLDSVKELSDTIAQRGLDFPLVVRPLDQPPYKYGLVCGHRRFVAATQLLGWTTVPATIRHGLSDREAWLLNLEENLERKDLNPVEEAKAIRRLYPDDAFLGAAAYELKRSKRWVEVRFGICRLPEEIQQYVAAGVVNLKDVERLIKMPQTTWLQTARDISKGIRKVGFKKRRQTKYAKKSPAQISAMIERLFDAGLDGLPTRLLAWTLGNVQDHRIEVDIRKEAACE